MLHDSTNDFEEQLIVNSLTGEIYNPFRVCENESQLLKWLLKNDHICNHEMFVINRQLSEKFSRGELQYDEVDITSHIFHCVSNLENILIKMIVY